MQNSVNWNKIYEEFSPKLLGICRRYVHSQAEAEDILQDSFLTAIQKADQLKNYSSLFPWLKKIVVNNSLLYLRSSNQRLFTLTDNETLQEIPTQMTFTLPEDHNTILGYDYTQEELLSSIDQLPAHHKSVFNLYYIEQYSHAEIAETLGINVNTSKSHLLRAKKSIQQFLTDTNSGNKSSALKRNGIKALVFLGFGNLLWAQAFRSKFNNFQITPEKHFTLDGKEFVFTGKTGVTLLTKGLAALALISGVVFVGVKDREYGLKNFFSPAENQTPAKEPAANLLKEDPENIAETAEKPLEIISVPVAEKPTEKVVEKISPLKNTPKTTIAESKPEKNKMKKPVIAKQHTAKDSAGTETERNKVVIYKKVIRRDTVYVER